MSRWITIPFDKTVSRRLPFSRGVYAVGTKEHCLYVGMTSAGFSSRWAGHHMKNNLLLIKSRAMYTSYLEMEDATTPEIFYMESRYIWEFQSLMNFPTWEQAYPNNLIVLEIQNPFKFQYAIPHLKEEFPELKDPHNVELTSVQKARLEEHMKNFKPFTNIEPIYPKVTPPPKKTYNKKDKKKDTRVIDTGIVYNQLPPARILSLPGS